MSKIALPIRKNHSVRASADGWDGFELFEARPSVCVIPNGLVPSSRESVVCESLLRR